MEELTSALMVFGSAFVVLVGAFLALAGLKGTCSASCDGGGGGDCHFCSKRSASGVRGGGAR